MKEIKSKTEYNYLSTLGWTIIFRYNRPVNYHADCGQLDVNYCHEDKVFTAMVEKMKDVVQITEIIQLHKVWVKKMDKVRNEHKQNVWDIHKIALD